MPDRPKVCCHDPNNVRLNNACPEKVRHRWLRSKTWHVRVDPCSFWDWPCSDWPSGPCGRVCKTRRVSDSTCVEERRSLSRRAQSVANLLAISNCNRPLKLFGNA